MEKNNLLYIYCGVVADNLAANFSRELADYIIYIIDVSGGDKIPRKGGPGITQADLLVCISVPVAAAAWICRHPQELFHEKPVYTEWLMSM